MPSILHHSIRNEKIARNQETRYLHPNAGKEVVLTKLIKGSLTFLILSWDCRSRRMPFFFQETFAISLTVAFLIRCRRTMHWREMSEPGLKNLAGGRLGKVDWSSSSTTISNIESESKKKYIWFVLWLLGIWSLLTLNGHYCVELHRRMSGYLTDIKTRILLL